MESVLNSIYPTIDQILLNGIAGENDYFRSNAEKYKRSKANEREYYKWKEEIFNEELKFNRTLERFWNGYCDETE